MDRSEFIGDLGTDGAAGVAVADSFLAVYQRSLGEVWRFDVAGRALGSFGREGRGPGEFAPEGWTRIGIRGHPALSWVDVLGDTLAVLDGATLQFFDRSGAYLGQARALRDRLRGMLFFSRRIRLVSGGVLIDLRMHLGATPSDRPQPRAYGIWRLTEAGAAELYSMELPALPQDGHGVQFRSTREARPLWDLLGRCVVVSDGSSPWVVLAALDGTVVDTVPIPLPDRLPPEDNEEQALLGRLGVSSSGSIPPAAPLRVRDLAVDPDGWVWILPLQPHGGVGAALEVLRVPVGIGQPAQDTVPAFPAAFGPDGTFFGIRRDAAGLRRLIRFSTSSR